MVESLSNTRTPSNAGNGSSSSNQSQRASTETRDRSNRSNGTGSNSRSGRSVVATNQVPQRPVSQWSSSPNSGSLSRGYDWANNGDKNLYGSKGATGGNAPNGGSGTTGGKGANGGKAANGGKGTTGGNNNTPGGKDVNGAKNADGGKNTNGGKETNGGKNTEGGKDANGGKVTTGGNNNQDGKAVNGGDNTTEGGKNAEGGNEADGGKQPEGSLYGAPEPPKDSKSWKQWIDENKGANGGENGRGGEGRYGAPGSGDSKSWKDYIKDFSDKIKKFFVDDGKNPTPRQPEPASCWARAALAASHISGNITDKLKNLRQYVPKSLQGLFYRGGSEGNEASVIRANGGTAQVKFGARANDIMRALKDSKVTGIVMNGAGHATAIKPGKDGGAVFRDSGNGRTSYISADRLASFLRTRPLVSIVIARKKDGDA